MASITVYTSPPHPDGPHVYPDGRWKVDEAGTLHVFRVLEKGRNLMLGAYGPATRWAVRAEDAR